MRNKSSIIHVMNISQCSFHVCLVFLFPSLLSITSVLAPSKQVGKNWLKLKLAVPILWVFAKYMYIYAYIGKTTIANLLCLQHKHWNVQLFCHTIRLRTYMCVFKGNTSNKIKKYFTLTPNKQKKAYTYVRCRTTNFKQSFN